MSPKNPVTPAKPITPTKPAITDPNDPNYDCKNDPNYRVNWDNECIDINEPWYDKKLFKLSDFDFTIGAVAVMATSTIIIIVLVAFAISSFIAWRKRKAIAAGARRMSASFRRMSRRLSTSVMGNKIFDQKENPEENDNGPIIFFKDSQIVNSGFTKA